MSPIENELPNPEILKPRGADVKLGGFCATAIRECPQSALHNLGRKK